MSETTAEVRADVLALKDAMTAARFNSSAAEQIMEKLDRMGWRLVPPAEGVNATAPTQLRPGQSTIAAEAQGMVYGDREADYGHPREDWTRAAIIGTGLLQHKLAEGAYLEAEDIARLQIGVKLARDVHAAKRDNRVDIVGYAIGLDRLETGR